MYLAKNISRFRKLKGLTLAELAHKVGCSINYIWEIEKGKKNNPSFNLVAKIAEELNVSIDEIAAPPNKIKKIKLDEFFRNFRKLDKKEQQGIQAQVNELIKIKKSAE